MSWLQIAIGVLFFIGVITTMTWVGMILWRAIQIPKTFVAGCYHHIQRKKEG
jgi:hypothetical protein